MLPFRVKPETSVNLCRPYFVVGIPIPFEALQEFVPLLFR